MNLLGRGYPYSMHIQDVVLSIPEKSYSPTAVLLIFIHATVVYSVAHLRLRNTNRLVSTALYHFRTTANRRNWAV